MSTLFSFLITNEYCSAMCSSVMNWLKEPFSACNINKCKPAFKQDKKSTIHYYIFTEDESVIVTWVQPVQCLICYGNETDGLEIISKMCC